MRKFYKRQANNLLFCSSFYLEVFLSSNGDTIARFTWNDQGDGWNTDLKKESLTYSEMDLLTFVYNAINKPDRVGIGAQDLMKMLEEELRPEEEDGVSMHYLSGSGPLMHPRDYEGTFIFGSYQKEDGQHRVVVWTADKKTRIGHFNLKRARWNHRWVQDPQYEVTNDELREIVSCMKAIQETPTPNYEDESKWPEYFANPELLL